MTCGMCSQRAAVVVIWLYCIVAGVVEQRAEAQQFTVLHTFHGANGADPAAPLTRDDAGNLYGTTFAGGKTCAHLPAGCDTVFKLDKTGKQAWLYKFDGEDGSAPEAGLLRDKTGNLYGTTRFGGRAKCPSPHGCGTVFSPQLYWRCRRSMADRRSGYGRNR